VRQELLIYIDTFGTVYVPIT